MFKASDPRFLLTKSGCDIRKDLPCQIIDGGHETSVSQYF